MCVYICIYFDNCFKDGILAFKFLYFFGGFNGLCIESIVLCKEVGAYGCVCVGNLCDLMRNYLCICLCVCAVCHVCFWSFMFVIT